jgi:peptidoglycan hydrolase-like protein with peptidoglycan-binding domain
VARARQLHAAIARYDGAVLRAGARGPAVQVLQRRLGLRADGVFGPRTFAAITTLQRRQHLTVDGVVGQRTWRALR